MEEIKNIFQYLSDEKDEIDHELENYNNMANNIKNQIEHSNRFVLSLLADNGADQTVFSPYTKNSDSQLDIEDERENIENLTNQQNIVNENISKLSLKRKKICSFLDELNKYADKDFYFVDCIQYELIQKLLDEFMKEIKQLTEDYEKKMNQFLFVDPNRIKIEFLEYKKKTDKLMDKIRDCQFLLKDNRLNSN